MQIFASDVDETAMVILPADAGWSYAGNWVMTE